ncbi:hypothetical protein BKA62DRAFT_344013 [Auriculariales sp. MPI-PUGE-AT-0066]|nr:hypothetical protein BKA62DRAFT_344013 [Auriculariales sp. MPI-PUGE-AT-0066]
MPAPASAASLRTSHLRSRLLVDLIELREQPLPGVTVHFDDADTSKVCLVVEPAEGHLASLKLHFDVQIPADFPLVPVKIENSTTLDHPNVFGNWICLDILKDEEEMKYYRDATYTGGFTPGYSLQGIFHQVASFFGTDNVPQSYGGYTKLSAQSGQARRRTAIEGLRKFRCPRCPFVPSTPPIITDLRTTADWVNPARRNEVTTRAVDTAPGSSLARPGRIVVGAGLAQPVTKSQRKAERRRRAKQQSELENLTSISAETEVAVGSEKTLVQDEPQDEQDSASVTVVEETGPSGPCFLEQLDADTLLHVFAFLNTTDLLSLAGAYSFASQLVSDANIVAAREIRCFVTKKSAGQALLGIGVRWDTQLKGLESSFDWLSREAWVDLNIRMGIRRETFTHWLPLAIHDGHFTRARKEIVIRLKAIEHGLVLGPGKGGAGRRDPSIDGYRALCSFANEIVVRLMKTADEVLTAPEPPRPAENDWSTVGGCTCPSCSARRGPQTTKVISQSPAGTLLHASEKALCDFISVIHLAVSLAASNPAIARDAARAVHRFIRYPNSRHKDTTPDLGELLVQLVLCSDVDWDDLRGPFLQQSFTRSVVWMLDQQQGRGLAGLACMEGESVSEWRLKTTFDASKTSLRLLMFQHAFLSQLPLLCTEVLPGARITPLDLKNGLDARYGLPPRDMPSRLVQSIKDIYAVNNYASFAVRLGMKAPGKQWMTQYLRERVQESAQSGYHRNPVPASTLLHARLKQDSDWAQRTPGRRAMLAKLRQSDGKVNKSFFPNRYTSTARR